MLPFSYTFNPTRLCLYIRIHNFLCEYFRNVLTGCRLRHSAVDGKKTSRRRLYHMGLRGLANINST